LSTLLISLCGKYSYLLKVDYQNGNKFIVDNLKYATVDSLNSLLEKNNLNSKISSYEIKSDVDEMNKKNIFIVSDEVQETLLKLPHF